MPLPHLASRLKRLGRQAFGEDPTRQPLLSPWDMEELQRLADNLQGILPPLRETTQPWLGEAASVYRGSGYEFDENRLYQPGDEARFINWRLYARTGQLHSKVFHEEHRPGVFILLDRRAGMRFGTRVRLKVAQAARLACLYLFVAQRQQRQVSGVNLEPDIHWHPASQGEAALGMMRRAFIRSCPPIAHATNQPPLATILRYVYAMLPAGQQIILISDFNDLRRRDGGPLQQLAARHALHAWQVLDPAEQALPPGHGYVFNDPGTGVSIDLQDTASDLRVRFSDQRQQHQRMCKELFQSCGIGFDRLLAHDDLNNYPRPS